MSVNWLHVGSYLILIHRFHGHLKFNFNVQSSRFMSLVQIIALLGYILVFCGWATTICSPAIAEYKFTKGKIFWNYLNIWCIFWIASEFKVWVVKPKISYRYFRRWPTTNSSKFWKNDEILKNPELYIWMDGIWCYGTIEFSPYKSGFIQYMAVLDFVETSYDSLLHLSYLQVHQSSLSMSK